MMATVMAMMFNLICISLEVGQEKRSSPNLFNISHNLSCIDRSIMETNPMRAWLLNKKRKIQMQINIQKIYPLKNNTLEWWIFLRGLKSRINCFKDQWIVKAILSSFFTDTDGLFFFVLVWPKPRLEWSRVHVQPLLV